ncbi:dihydrofolate reductase family protein [Aquihabitans sp. G128]|uniref:dihydrofolate reductase family protein n=1 Tax=Aquihabitans sp. G128 TaxID=2849779 RepID=UPI001C242F45|nr:dihydrofolate reductase family protein [Aquihabitans sp. G128]QXC60755.1 dihydrofolate reductase family protein [Aquihabitans sp. G128]
MRTLIVTEFVTLDGVVEAPGGEPTHPHTGWVEPMASDELMAWKQQETMDADALLIGRTTYESFAGAWPTYEGPMADKMNSMPKFVVSSTLVDPEWPATTVLDGPNPLEQVAELKASEGGPLLVAGSITLVHALLDADLVDELHLQVFPVFVGHGLRLFPNTERPAKATWSLVDSQTYAHDVRSDVYRPA